jgi:N-ethylmaleimide reductase
MTTLFDPIRFGNIASANRIVMAPLTRKDVSVPRALRLEELPNIVAEYSHGGTKENRARFPLEVMKAIVAEIGAGRTGLCLSPVTPVNDAGQDSDAQGLFNYFVEQLGPLRLAFIHVIEGATGGRRDIAKFDYAALRSRFKLGNEQGAWIVNNGYTRAMAIDAVSRGVADMVAFGKPFISNPDLVNRLRLDAPLTALNNDTLYGGNAIGYTDYPTLDSAHTEEQIPTAVARGARR